MKIWMWDMCSLKAMKNKSYLPKNILRLEKGNWLV